LNELTPAFLLHARDYRDTSLLIELFTPNTGRISAVAKGARRVQRGSTQRAILQPLQPLWVECGGRGELKTLRTAEVRAVAIPLRGNALFSAFYLNELLCRLLPRDDAHPQLFSDYEITLEQLGGKVPLDISLRLFELRLLEDLGYGFSLTHAGETGLPLNPDWNYRYDPLRGLLPIITANEKQRHFPGSDFLSFQRGDYTESARRSLKLVCRLALQVHLGDKPLQSRSLIVRPR
jgi:DNA repair protein RecO (recombination protein O)